VALDPLRDAAEAGQVGVVGRGLAANREAVVEAARLCAIAEGGQVLTSELVREFGGATN